jgi:hypothetical protein
MNPAPPVTSTLVTLPPSARVTYGCFTLGKPPHVVS